jgi:hypothetical protein
MEDETTLRQLAREALRSGKLLNRRPDRMWGGPGAGTLCSVCGKPVQREETGFELEYAAEDGRSLCNHALHFRCFAAWEFERREDESVPRANAVRTNGHALSSHEGDGTIVPREPDVRSPWERA